jgi:hypothetical protein
LNSQWQKDIKIVLNSLIYTIPFFIPAYIVIFLDNIGIHSLLKENLSNPFLKFYGDSLFLSIRHIAILLLCSLIAIKSKKTKNWFIKKSGLVLLVVSLLIFIIGIDFSFVFSSKWYNSIWCLYYLSSGALISVSFWVLFLRNEMFAMQNNSNTLVIHNIGKLLFLFTFLWGYFFYIQYLIINYTEIAEEQSLYSSRLNGLWEIIFFSFIILSFVIPFVTLLFQKVKKNLYFIKIISKIIIAGQVLHFYWILYSQITTSDFISLLLSLTIFFFFFLSFNRLSHNYLLNNNS